MQIPPNFEKAEIHGVRFQDLTDILIES
jgi:hypothetical protein